MNGYAREENAILWVPSVVSSYESDLLFNQQHKEFRRVIIGDPKPAHLDPRFWWDALKDKAPGRR